MPLSVIKPFSVLTDANVRGGAEDLRKVRVGVRVTIIYIYV